ncbi:hypothetical protein K8P10_000869 [Leucobacter sp. Psy1]|uniref:GAP family protein n=1 Tax=Leucobacter sp. Psy1 TaxID=2875729 RepID=UPI001CD2ECC3|nr:GAP family protein [Leucobacter sp. Psy1]UBH05358.1 hypothetical protein K8P10_000869 [Leucobacter sp. Psy1]
MHELVLVIWRILPVVLGLVASPLAVLVILGIVLSDRPIRNSACFSVGWASSIATLLVCATVMLRLTGAHESPVGTDALRYVHLLIALICGGGAIWTFRRSRTLLERAAVVRSRELPADTTAELPGLVRMSRHSTAPRSLILGAGVFAANPTNLSLILATAIDITFADLAPPDKVWLAVGFVAVASIPVLVPTMLLIAGGDRAVGPLTALRGWVLRNNGFLRAGLLLLVAFLQLDRAFIGSRW